MNRWDQRRAVIGTRKGCLVSRPFLSRRACPQGHTTLCRLCLSAEVGLPPTTFAVPRKLDGPLQAASLSRLYCLAYFTLDILGSARIRRTMAVRVKVEPEEELTPR